LRQAEQWQRAVRLFHKQLNDNNEDIFNLSNDKYGPAQYTAARHCRSSADWGAPI
jgi:hypothetical protein